MELDKLDKEVKSYENLSKEELRKVMKKYKSLLFWSRDDVNFIYTFVIMFSVSIFFRLDFFLFVSILLIHYLYFWKYLIIKQGKTITSKKEADEIRYILSKLEEMITEKNK